MSFELNSKTRETLVIKSSEFDFSTLPNSMKGTHFNKFHKQTVVAQKKLKISNASCKSKCWFSKSKMCQNSLINEFRVVFSLYHLDIIKLYSCKKFQSLQELVIKHPLACKPKHWYKSTRGHNSTLNQLIVNFS